MIAIVCFASGYALYPTFNDTEFDTASTSVVKGVNDVIEDIAVVKMPNSTVKLTTNSGNSNPAGLSANTKGENVKLDIANEDKKVDTLIKDQITDETVVAVQKELEEWSIMHRDHIDGLITAHMSSENAEHMKLKVSKDNEFLIQPPIKQDPIEDDNWAYNMEQQLKLLISQHELSENFQLLNLSCKQLTCDIFGVEKEANTWFKLYVSLLQNAPNVEFPDGNNDPKSVIYMENDVAVVYSQIRFKSS